MDAEPKSSVPTRALQRARLAPSRLSWLIAVFLLIVQQGAFVLIPLFSAGDTDSEITYTKGSQFDNVEELHNFLSPASRILSFLLLTITLMRRLRDVAIVVVDNPFVFMFAAMLFISALWSIHPDLTLKWALNYLMTISVAVYLVVYFPGNDAFKVLSHSFAISAIGSILFVLMFPSLGIMSGDALEGNWRGVFYHKNNLGEVMTIATFAQLYLLAARVGRRGWGIFWTAVFYGLVVLSRSGTSLIISSLYISMFFVYFLWLQHKVLGYGAAAMFVIILIMIGINLAVDPETMLGLMGKDKTLTGRTQLWAEVADLIAQKPWLGWGFGATFIGEDPTTILIWERIGWLAPHSHNSYLQKTLELGYIGLILMFIFIGAALWRGLRCCWMGVLPLGYFALVFFIESLLAGWSEAFLGDGGWIWLVFTFLALACGQGLSRRQGSRPAKYAARIGLSASVPMRHMWTSDNRG
jgi:exopolysaccharide production protein ExoQ